MRYRSESRYTASEHSCHYVGNLFPNSSSGSIVTPPFIGGASFPPARAKQTATLRWYASRVHNPFPPMLRLLPPQVFAVSFFFPFFSLTFLFSPSSFRLLGTVATTYLLSTLVRQTFIIARVSR